MSSEYTFSSKTILVSKTDVQGKITYVNEQFKKIAGYNEKELLGQPHSIVRHPEMPKVIFKFLWNYLKEGKEINAYVKNSTKEGGYYWVYANVTPSFDATKRVIGYHSTRRKPEAEALKVIIPLYQNLLAIEKKSGLAGSEAFLKNILDDNKVTYDEYVFSL